jgi:hypothetical protein
VKLPKCEYCEMEAQYDFVDDGGEWRYGCVNHWMKYRASKQIGPGHAKHLTAGETPPKRPAGYVPPAIDPTRLVKPRVSVALQASIDRPTPITGGSTGERPAREKKEKGPRKASPKEFVDMEPKGMEIKEPRPGSVMAITLDIIKEKGGATLEEIQAAIGPKHDALKLLVWMNENRGYGWKKDAAGKIHTVYYGGNS